MISVIIPIYNEEKILRDKSLYFTELAKHSELIFIDGGSSDMSLHIAGEYGSVLSSKKGRALQMNYGANFSQKDTLLFLHADTRISTDTLISIENKISKNGILGGCLTQHIDRKAIIYRLIEKQGNIRAKITKVFYGDQGIFIKKDLFYKLGGFPEVPIMEDVLFTRKLRKAGKTIVLSDKIFVSSRRWEKNGIIKTTLLFNLIIILFLLKVPLHKIKQFYDDIR